MELNVFPFIFMLMIHCPDVSEGSGTIISPPRPVSTCPGEQLKLECTENQFSLLWTIILPGENITYTRLVPFTGNTGLTPIKVTFNGTDAVAFNFTLTSEAMTLPLITDLCIDRIYNNMHGTEIHCSPSKESDPQVTFIIYVLGANSDLLLLEVEQSVYNLNDTNFTVILNWSQEDRVSYNISIDPITELVHLMNNTWQVIGYYNTLYNVSIVATLCEEYSKTTNILLEYVTCELLTKESIGIHDPMLKINNTESRNPARVGDSVKFYCLSGELMGQNRTTCQSSGKWEPDPSGLLCRQMSISSCFPPSPPPNGYINFHSSETSITFVCQNSTITEEVHIISHCNSFGKWVPNPTQFCSGGKQSSNINISIIIGSSISCFILSSVICLLLGCCCLVSTKYKSKQTVERNSNDGSVPIYDDLLPVPVKSKENELKLKENVAYNSLEIRQQSNSSSA